MVFPFSYQITQGQRSQNGVAHQGPHSVTVHIATGKPPKYSDPSGEGGHTISHSSGAGFVSSETLGAKFSLLRQVVYS